MGRLEELLEKLWGDYARINPQAEKIHGLLTQRGEQIINDHIAFRTFNIPKININVLAKTFVSFGYQPKGEYQFPEKKLFARHFEHPDQNNPKIFISELKLEECSQDLQNIVKGLAAEIPEAKTKERDFSVSGAAWQRIPWAVYEKLRKESEYASWVSAFGFRANHFTVLVNSLKSFKTLQELNEFLKKNGFRLNASGGEIKGSPQEFLEQSSTLADPVEVGFADRREKIPSCYYEFAWRYPLPSGKLFQGFVAQSANKIFESTDKNK